MSDEEREECRAWQAASLKTLLRSEEGNMSLAFITQNRLQLFAAGAAALAAYFLPTVNRYGVWASVAVYLLAYFLPNAFGFLKNFADVPQWPKLVACGVGILFASAHGHVAGVLTCAALVAGIDGAFWPY